MNFDEEMRRKFDDEDISIYQSPKLDKIPITTWKDSFSVETFSKVFGFGLKLPPSEIHYRINNYLVFSIKQSNFLQEEYSKSLVQNKVLDSV